jgi:diacylglycerol O-acyltransferase / wax synthase
VRADSERGALGNKVSAMYAPLPVGLEDPIARFRAVHDAMRGLKESGQAVGAEMIASLADFAPPTILSQAARLQAVQRLFNLTVTNVPGPQFPLYLLGRPLCRVYPQVPLAENCALGIAIMSYHGRIDFGLVADYDALPDLDAVAVALEGAIAELAVVAGVDATPAGNGAARRTRTRQRA